MIVIKWVKGSLGVCRGVINKWDINEILENSKWVSIDR